MKKLNRLVLVCSAAALPQLAMADQLASQQLGLDMVHHILIDYCAKVDPRDASAFRAIWQNLLSHVSDGDDYKPVFEFSGASDPGAPALCASLATGVSKKGPSNGKEDRNEKEDRPKRG